MTRRSCGDVERTEGISVCKVDRKLAHNMEMAPSILKDAPCWWWRDSFISLWQFTDSWSITLNPVDAVMDSGPVVRTADALCSGCSPPPSHVKSRTAPSPCAYLSLVSTSRDLRVSCGLCWLDALTAQPCTKVQLEGFWCSFQGDILIIRSRRPAQPSPSVSPPTHQRDARLCVRASSPPINRAKSKL